MNKIPVTVFSGFLGSGKTTIILNLIKQLPKDYKVVWLKNEYGDINVDSVLAQESNIQTSEILNGCLCCVLVGKIEGALQEIKNKFEPDRIIIETAGTAYPYSIVMEVNRLDFTQVDGMIDVIDAQNFKGYTDKSIIAKAQAPFTNLIVINKTGMVSEDELETRLDDVYEVFPETPKYKTRDGVVPKELLLGLDPKQIELNINPEEHFHEEGREIETFGFTSENKVFDLEKVVALLKTLPVEQFIRIKGIVRAEDGYYVINNVFGDTDIQKVEKYSGPTKITFMGDDVKTLESSIMAQFEALQ